MAVRSRGPITELRGRWQTLQLLSPVFELLNRAAPRAEFDHRGYDLAQLALRLIDYVVVHQASLEGAVTPSAAVDHLTQLSRRMHPVDPDRPWSKVARMVFATVLNNGRPHEAVWVEPESELGPARTEEFRFRLLRLADSEAGPCVTASDEAIVLYLQALNTDLADRALALKLMVEIQMNAGEFEKALESARQATRTARGLSASLRERLADTKRDVSAVDWQGEMPVWLTDVVGQVGQQLERDHQLRELAAKFFSDVGAATVCRSIDEEVQRGQEVWIRLERYLQQAIPVFLEAQAVQRFQPRGLAVAIDLSRDVLDPALGRDDLLEIVAERLITGVAPPVRPACWGLGDLCDILLRIPVAQERRPPDIDDPGELGEAIGDSIPADSAAVAAEILSGVSEKPARLSELLTAGRDRAADVADPARLLDILWGAALWTFVVDADATPEERPQSTDLAAAVAALVATLDDRQLADERYSGSDLLLASPISLDRMDLDSEEIA
ncbi:hypothetical protein [Nocardia arthritidis]|uniref:Uncharacterized protein n=1 Tax=Nocardia arthritidis TaxID=228602 RepID=A0A6G9YE71_9NOCA|nr:hypothetical protein [Nocardia arthritidis]QIS11492.1 hypothetical protein F5544_18090 [Nocardia arthritidis]